uniref:Ribosomal protein L5 n=1 Tax=Pharyngomonas kirbyi TaxID=63601 RepID=A0A1W6R256_9EUKA|nr:ribosomal protein L5 [Pharyngomonas kirbyi]ARO47983.1 ribosomal protein L5 [Pharyngomonas kirbyi]
MFYEQVAGQALSKNWSKHNINEFNLKPSLELGSGVTLRRSNMYSFLHKWITMSQKLAHYTGNFRGLYEKPITSKTGVSLGLWGAEDFEPVFSTFERWAVLPDNYRQGCFIHVVINGDNTLMNELFLGHIGFNLRGAKLIGQYWSTPGALKYIHKHFK